MRGAPVPAYHRFWFYSASFVFEKLIEWKEEHRRASIIERNNPSLCGINGRKKKTSKRIRARTMGRTENICYFYKTLNTIRVRSPSYRGNEGAAWRIFERGTKWHFSNFKYSRSNGSSTRSRFSYGSFENHDLIRYRCFGNAVDLILINITKVKEN